MNLFGLSITRRTKAAVAPVSIPWANVPARAGWFSTIKESFSGAWQRNVTLSVPDAMTHHVVWACVTLIASDISKLWVSLVEESAEGITTDVTNPAYTPVLRKPNHYQTRIKFYESWMLCKLLRGNAYALKQRDRRGVVTSMYLLDPQRVTPLVAPDSSVYYQVSQDNLSRVPEPGIVVPASEMFHDLMVPLYHPLCGVSPLHALALPILQALNAESHATKVFQNGALPAGILTTPQHISTETAQYLEKYWTENYSGHPEKIAALGDGLEFKALGLMTALDTQLIDQLKWTAEAICTAFHVPPFMVGVGPLPAYNNIEVLTIQYYQQCLHQLIECLEEVLTLGLSVSDPLSVEFDLRGLLRMDTATRVRTATEGIRGGLMAPNEGRKWINLPSVDGGDSVYMQQQQFSLEALAERDENKPFSKPAPPAAPPPARPAMTDAQESRTFEAFLRQKMMSRAA